MLDNATKKEDRLKTRTSNGMLHVLGIATKRRLHEVESLKHSVYIKSMDDRYIKIRLLYFLHVVLICNEIN